jgi:membrane-associated phospholipid phosphatase
VRAIAVSVLAGLIALATVYNQMHFAVDTIAGIAVAVVTQAIVVPALLGRSPARAEQTGEAARAAPRVLPEAA